MAREDRGWSGVDWRELLEFGGSVAAFVPNGAREALAALRRGLDPGADLLLAGPTWLLQELAAVAANRLVDRDVELRAGGTDISLHLEAIEASPTPLGAAAGQLDGVTVIATDVAWPGVRLARLVIKARNMHVRPGRAATIVAAPVLVEFTIAYDEVARWLPHLPASLRLDVAPRIGRVVAPVLRDAHLEMALSVDGRTLRARPRALVVGRRRVSAGVARLPALAVALDDLPPHLRLHEMECAEAGIVARGSIAEWHYAVMPSDLRRVLRTLASASTTIDLPGSAAAV